MTFDIYPFSVGHARCFALKDGDSAADAADTFRGADAAELAAAARRYGFDPERMVLSFSCLLIELGGARVLIDSGRGQRLFELLETLEIAPTSIDVLVLTHAHMDHYGGHLDDAGAKRFPNARYLMWRDEWLHYSAPEQLERDRGRLGERFATLEQRFLPLGPHLEFLDATNPEIAPGIVALPAPGHSRHHLAVELVSGRETLLFVGDAALHPLAFEHQEWGFIADLDAERAGATRRLLADRALASDALVMGYHFPFPGLGKLWHRRDGLLWGPRRIERELIAAAEEGTAGQAVSGDGSEDGAPRGARSDEPD